MVSRSGGMKRFLDPWWWVDWIFPIPQPLSKDESKLQEDKDKKEKNEIHARVLALPNIAGNLKEYLIDCTKLLQREEQRRQSVEARLTSIIALCSIAGTIVFGGILAQASGSIHFNGPLLKWVFAAGALYLTLQICSAILAAIKGLERKSWETMLFSDIIPATKEDRNKFLRLRILRCLEILQDHRTNNNDKTTQMAVAHCALRNFLSVLIIIALVGTFCVADKNPKENIIETLKNNRELMELIRGPQGPPGPVGPKGEPGHAYTLFAPNMGERLCSYRTHQK